MINELSHLIPSWEGVRVLREDENRKQLRGLGLGLDLQLTEQSAMMIVTHSTEASRTCPGGHILSAERPPVCCAVGPGYWASS